MYPTEIILTVLDLKNSTKLSLMSIVLIIFYKIC